MSAAVLADLARPALASFAVSLIAAALLGRIAPRTAWLAVPAGLLVGLIDLVGVRLVTPRLLPERLPWLVAASAAVAPFLADRGHAGWVASGLAALVGAWWLVGAPRTAPDLERVAASASAVALLILAALAPWSVRSSRGELSSLGLAAVATAALLALAGPAPLFSALALVAAGAAIGAVLAPGAPSPPAAAAVPLAAALAGTAAVAWLAEPSLAVSAAAALPVVLHGALGARR